MSMTTVPDFKHFETLHCVTGSMRHVYAWAGRDLSEELLLGLGEGVGFAYFRFKGQLPFLGGRAQPKPSMEELAGSRTGVTIERKSPTSDAAAERSLVAELDAGRPAMLQVDMGCLPYFDFGGQEYHFGGHVVVACGRDAASGDYLVADREGPLHPVPAEALTAARSSRYKPFPPNRAWWRFGFEGARKPRREELALAIRDQSALMLEPPIANIGVKGIRKAAKECVTWPELLEPKMLAAALFNLYIFVSAKGGSGGGCFRYMFGRFLTEAASLGTEAASLGAGAAVAKLAASFKAIGDAWEEAAELCRSSSEGSSFDAAAAKAALPELSRRLASIADLEEAAWKALAAASS
jgi:hypothetical protein